MRLAVLAFACLCWAGLSAAAAGIHLVKGCPNGAAAVQCEVSPCSTQPCKDKCAQLGSRTNVQCLDNYCGGCNCDCCLKKHQTCLQDSECCPGLQCGITNSCAVGYMAICDTQCELPKDLMLNCLGEGEKCLNNRQDCCGGTSCQYDPTGKTVCLKCHQADETCDPNNKNDCCPYMDCVQSGSTYKCV